MEENHVVRIVAALNQAIGILRDAEGRRNVADIRVQSILAAARDMLAFREPPAFELRRKGEPAEFSVPMDRAPEPGRTKS